MRTKMVGLVVILVFSPHLIAGDVVVKGKTEPAPGKSSAIGVEIVSRLTEIHVKPGDHVTKGTKVLTLNPTPAELEVKKKAVSVADAALHLAKGLLHEEEERFARAESLYAKQSMSKESFEERRSAKIKAHDSVVLAKANLDLAKTVLKAMETGSYSYNWVYSQIDGVVTHMTARTGITYYPGTKTLGLIVDVSELDVIACVQPEMASALRKGEKATVIVKGLKKDTEISGEIEFISPVCDEKGCIPVTVRIHNPVAYTEKRMEAGKQVEHSVYVVNAYQNVSVRFTVPD